MEQGSFVDITRLSVQMPASSGSRGSLASENGRVETYWITKKTHPRWYSKTHLS
jgi:hypothetical protein